MTRGFFSSCSQQGPFSTGAPPILTPDSQPINYNAQHFNLSAMPTLFIADIV